MQVQPVARVRHSAIIDSAYLGTNLEDKVTINTRGIQEWTVPESGTYRIEAWGARW